MLLILPDGPRYSVLRTPPWVRLVADSPTAIIASTDYESMGPKVADKWASPQSQGFETLSCSPFHDRKEHEVFTDPDGLSRSTPPEHRTQIACREYEVLS